jgi:aspartate/methionine/tyrosine aminotransferase
VATGSLTKFWGLGPLRIGWLVGPEAFVTRAGQMAVHLSDVAGPSRTLARRALSARERLCAEAGARCRQNYDLLAEFVADHPDLSGPVYDGCSFAFLSHADEDVDGDELAAAAWEEGVLVVPGRFFGAPDGVRVALGHPPDRCAAALSALDAALEAL